MAEPDKKMSAEDDLLRRCAADDAEAYRELVARLEKPLVNFLLRYVGERHVAEDLFQETFVRVVRGLSSFRPDAALSTWIYTIARNLALDHLKAKRRHRETPLDAAATESGDGRQPAASGWPSSSTVRHPARLPASMSLGLSPTMKHPDRSRPSWASPLRKAGT